VKLIVAPLRALGHYISREFAFTIRKLIDSYHWKQVEFSHLSRVRKPLKEALLAEFGELPRVILFWEGYDFVNSRAREILALDCLKAIFADDLHSRTDEVRCARVAAYLLCDVVFSAYGDRFQVTFPEVCRLTRVIWAPHSASPDFLIPWNPQAENAVFVSGAVSRHYPFREAVRALHDTGRYAMTYQPHPGYHCGYDYATDSRVGADYARALNRHRVAFTDSSVHRYLVAKFFEIPATGALLLADRAVTQSLRQLGLFEDEHYVSVSPDDFEERVQHVLDEANHPQLDAIRRRAQALIWERHTTSNRARLIEEECRA
jgi:hypothetical protein